MSMNDDIRKYPCFMVYNGLVVPALWLENTENYNHYCYDLHHFIRQSVRKNSPDFYKRVEHLQRLILMPKQMNLDLEELGAEDFYKKWKVDKDNLVFNRKRWREGLYEAPPKDYELLQEGL